MADLFRHFGISDGYLRQAAELRQLEVELLRLEAEDEGHGEAWLREQEARIEREHAQAQVRFNPILIRF